MANVGGAQGQALLPSLLAERTVEAGEKEKPAAAPQPVVQRVEPKGVAFFCKQFGKRVWQFGLYLCFVAPPAVATGVLCATMLYGIKVATALRDGVCQGSEGPLGGLLDTERPLTACTNVVGANRWLFFLLSFVGMFVAALYTFLGNSNAAGGMNTILLSIRKLEEEIDRVAEEQRRREAGGQPLEPVQPGEFQGMVALRMCPLVWIGTVTTHLCGGAAGREGSALQMAAPIFSKYCDFLDATLGRANANFRMTVQMRRAALVAAIASGFAGVFGVPVTGAIFAVEVLRVGELTIGEMLQPAIIGAFFADWTCRLMTHALQFESHSHYACERCQASNEPSWNNGLELLAVVPAAFAFGLAGYAFEWLLHHFKDIFGRLAGMASRGNGKAKSLLTPFLGGWVVVLMWLVLCSFGSESSLNFESTYDGTDPKSATFAQAYLGLSVYEPGVSISSCFVKEGPEGFVWPSGPLAGTAVQPIMWYSFLLKLLFTTVTLGAGFKGGEVTPIFFIGAALGNVCGVALGQDTQLFSALGLCSVFAAAANTPIACTFMGIELFGGNKALAFLLSCFLSYLVSNTEKVNGIYAAQDKPKVHVMPFSRTAPHRR